MERKRKRKKIEEDKKKDKQKKKGKSLTLNTKVKRRKENRECGLLGLGVSKLKPIHYLNLKNETENKKKDKEETLRWTTSKIVLWQWTFGCYEHLKS